MSLQENATDHSYRSDGIFPNLPLYGSLVDSSSLVSSHVILFVLNRIALAPGATAGYRTWSGP
jgi:hypothetical protein